MTVKEFNDLLWWVLREASPEPKQDPPALTLEDWKTLNILLDRFVDLACQRAEAFKSPGWTASFDGDISGVSIGILLSDPYDAVSQVRFTPDELLMSEAEWKNRVEERKAEEQARLEQRQREEEARNVEKRRREYEKLKKEFEGSIST